MSTMARVAWSAEIQGTPDQFPSFVIPEGKVQSHIAEDNGFKQWIRLGQSLVAAFGQKAKQ
jgi:hypothetical protein